MKKILCVTSLFLLCTAIAFAGSAIDGGWAGQIGTGDTAQTIQMSLTVDGTTLSGSVVGGGNEMSIQQGTFDGSKLQFKAVNGGGDDAVAINCTGSYAADTITFACTAADQSTRVFTVSRKQ